MKKLIVFDFKNTLLTEQGDWLDGAQQAVLLARRSSYELLLYSMNEQWTYTMLQKFSKEFCVFTSILLVTKKIETDLKSLRNQYESVVVVGDSVKEELAFACTLNYPFLKVTQSISMTKIAALLEQRR